MSYLGLAPTQKCRQMRYEIRDIKNASLSALAYRAYPPRHIKPTSAPEAKCDSSQA